MPMVMMEMGQLYHKNQLQDRIVTRVENVEHWIAYRSIWILYSVHRISNNN